MSGYITLRSFLGELDCKLDSLVFSFTADNYTALVSIDNLPGNGKTESCPSVPGQGVAGTEYNVLIVSIQPGAVIGVCEYQVFAGNV